MSDDRERGLYDKYQVERRDGKPLKGGCIVLEFGDPNAFPALKTWAHTMRVNGYEAVADDVEKTLTNMWDAASEEKGDEIGG